MRVPLLQKAGSSPLLGLKTHHEGVVILVGSCDGRDKKILGVKQCELLSLTKRIDIPCDFTAKAVGPRISCRRFEWDSVRRRSDSYTVTPCFAFAKKSPRPPHRPARLRPSVEVSRAAGRAPRGSERFRPAPRVSRRPLPKHTHKAHVRA